MRRLSTFRVLLCTFCCLGSGLAFSADDTNEPINSPGRLPLGDNGQPLNLNFETGDLTDWTATGEAWQQQPIHGPIDPNRPFGADKNAHFTGDYWIGGYEKLEDAPQGTLTSAAFKVTAPWCSFLASGGTRDETRVELARADNGQVFFRVSGIDQETLQPVVVDLSALQGQKIQIRLVDESSEGWGHLNFDDFRLHDKKPEFRQETLKPKNLTPLVELYPFENLSGEEAARVMQVPPGFRVQLAAQEPDVQQPVAMAIDHRGRIWIAEAMEYPTRAKPGEGHDRILIFEDTDLDGTLDSRKVFVENLNLVSALEVGFDGVWVGAAPYLMYIPDRNGNDIPDGEEPDEAGNVPQRQPIANVKFWKDIPNGSEVLLDGWAHEDTHEVLNSLTWGPDGWLYGCHGVFTHSLVGKPGMTKEERVPINAGIWRYHPTRHVFEVFAHGTSNPWGIAFDEFGEAFCTACVIPHLYHIIPGGRYQRQAGSHFNPYTFGDIQTIARHRHFVGNQWNTDDQHASDDAGGGHAHAGALIYQGGAWPEEYRGKLFMHNIHGNRVNVDVLIPEGSGYAGDRNPDFLMTGDKWSQMIDLQCGPDGQVWMIDWYDQNQCHRVEEQVHDRSNGRIFRVSYGDAKNVKVDLTQMSTKELVELALTADNEWYARHARRVLQERDARGEDIATLGFVGSLPEELDDPVRQLRMLWLNHAVENGVVAVMGTDMQWLGDAEPHTRNWAVRLLMDELAADGRELSANEVKGFAGLVRDNDSPIFRLAMASALQRVRPEYRWTVLEALVSYPEDAQDHNLPMMYWYAMEPLADVDPTRALALSMTAGKQIPMLREFMIRRLGTAKPEESLELLVQGLAQSEDDDVRLTFLQGILASLVGQDHPQPPKDWDAVYQKLSRPNATSQDFDVYLYTLGVAAQFGNQEASERLREIVVDEAGPREERKVVFGLLADASDPQLGAIVTRLLKGTTLRAEALNAVARLNDPAIAQAVIDSYSTLTSDERRAARNALASRPGYARMLLKAVASQRVAKADLSADLIRQFRNLNDVEVNRLVEQVWGVVRESDADRKALVAHYHQLVSSPAGKAASVEFGRAVFAKTCQQCHTLFGTGGKVGPDITGSNRADLTYLLSNVLDPSAVMAKEYQPWVIATDTGRVITGILKEESDQALKIQTTEELVTVPANEIEIRKQSEKSMMPDDLLRNLTEYEVRSLVAYLGSKGQVALQATPETAAEFSAAQELKGWRASRSDDENAWNLDGGEIVGTANSDHAIALINELQLHDFRFRCEVKTGNGSGTGGMVFRAHPQPDGELQGLRAGIGGEKWGTLTHSQGEDSETADQKQPTIHADAWNTYEIVAVGPRVRGYLNGETVFDAVDLGAAREGVLAFELDADDGSEVRFRNLQLSLLDGLPAYAAAGATPGQWPESSPLKAGQKIEWEKTRLDDLFRSEGCCIADFNNDGWMDIATGSVWYENVAHAVNDDHSEALQWKRHTFLEEAQEFDPAGYSNTFMNFADDLNHDGWVDLIVVDFPGNSTWWFQNPGDASDEKKAWTRHQITPVTNNESPQYLDLNGDGVRELLCGVENGVMAYITPQSHPQALWEIHPISQPGSPGTDRFSHGLGAADVNADGRADVVIPQGWWEQPAESTQTWTFHQAPLGPDCSHMYGHDFDGDGLTDLLSASAHGFGVWWHWQRPDSQWETITIDETFSQTHSVMEADFNGDGQPDFVTGKRYWAHGGHDPGADQPPVINWFELTHDDDGKPKWVKHQIDDNSGVGTQFDVGDVNNDGLIDVVTSNKHGTYVLLQKRVE